MSNTVLMVLINYILIYFPFSITLLIHTIHIACCLYWHPIEYHICVNLYKHDCHPLYQVSDNLTLTPPHLPVFPGFFPFSIPQQPLCKTMLPECP